MGTRLVNGGRIRNGNFETFNKDTGRYDSLGEDADGNNLGQVDEADFGKTEVGKATPFSGTNQAVINALARTGKSSGLTTSDSAAGAVDEANDTLNDMEGETGSTGNSTQDQLTALFEQISNTRAQLATAKENEKIAKDNLDNNEMTSKLEGLKSSEEAGGGKQDLADGINAVNDVVAGGEADSSAVDDPVLQAMTDSTITKVKLAQAQQTRLNDFAKTMSRYAQADIDDINATALRAVERQVAENDRVQRAMRGAGILAGRSQMAPTTQGSIINEIIEDGLDRINVIENKKTTAIRAARKAETEFNYALFTESVEIAKQLNTDIENSVKDLRAQVRQAEKDEQDAITFRQEQEERNALILAGELVGATPELIQQTALANGIDPGLLAKAVNDAKFEASNRKFTEQSNTLTLANKREDLIKKRTPDAPKAVVLPKDVEQGFRSVARLSKKASESAWSDIQTFGLDDAVTEIWLPGGYSKDQVKSMVAAHEQSQRNEDEDGNAVITATESTLNAVIDNWQTQAEKDMESTFGGDTISSPETFYKNR